MIFRFVFEAAGTVSIFRPEIPDLSIRYFLIRFKRVAAEAAVLLLAVAVEFHAGDAREFCDATAVPFSQALKPSLDRMTKDIVVAVLGPVETNGVRK